MGKTLPNNKEQESNSFQGLWKYMIICGLVSSFPPFLWKRMYSWEQALTKKQHVNVGIHVRANQEHLNIRHWEIFCPIFSTLFWFNKEIIKWIWLRSLCTRDTSLGDQRNQPAMCRVQSLPSLVHDFPPTWQEMPTSFTNRHPHHFSIVTGFSAPKILLQCFPGPTQPVYLTFSAWLFPQPLI